MDPQSAHFLFDKSQMVGIIKKKQTSYRARIPPPSAPTTTKTIFD
jgi:hypothetical protein